MNGDGAAAAAAAIARKANTDASATAAAAPRRLRRGPSTREARGGSPRRARFTGSVRNYRGRGSRPLSVAVAERGLPVLGRGRRRVARQETSGQAPRIAAQVVGRALRDEMPASLPTLRPELDHPVGCLDELEV